MLLAITGMFEKKDTNREELSNKCVSVRSPDELNSLEKIIVKGPVTYIFVHADWCGYCQTYKPIWNDLLNIPGRTANMGMIHHDMVEKSRILKNAKIPGYPTVLKVFPNAHIEVYKGENNEMTNAIPNIRDVPSMTKEILSTPVMNSNNIVNNTLKTDLRNSKNRSIPVTDIRVKKQNNTKQNNTKQNNTKQNNTKRNNKKRNNTKQNNTKENNVISNIFPVSQNTKRNIADSVKTKNMNMKGGSLFTVLSRALMQKGPHVILIAKRGSVLPPKKSRGTTKRLTRKSQDRKRHKN